MFWCTLSSEPVLSYFNLSKGVKSILLLVPDYFFFPQVSVPLNEVQNMSSLATYAIPNQTPGNVIARSVNSVSAPLPTFEASQGGAVCLEWQP